MPINKTTLNTRLFELLKTQGLSPAPLDSLNKVQEIPDKADLFRFDFKGKPAWVTIDDMNNLELYYNDDIDNEHSEEWTRLLKLMKSWAQRKQMGWKLTNKDHLHTDMAKRTEMKKESYMFEGYHALGKKASYNDNVPSVKIVIEHTRPIQEGEQRYRNISRIFLENEQGERILAPTVKPGIAQVYARHLAEGGLPHDEKWKHIGSLCEEYQKMSGFVRAVRNGQFNESAQQLVNEGLNHYQSLRETLSKMRGHRGYNTYFESWTPALMETEDEENTLSELFVQETLDPRIESVMPILSKLHKKVSEMKEVDQLESWADDVINENLGISEASREPRYYVQRDAVRHGANRIQDAKIMLHARGPFYQSKEEAEAAAEEYRQTFKRDSFSVHPEDMRYVKEQGVAESAVDSSDYQDWMDVVSNHASGDRALELMMGIAPKPEWVTTIRNILTFAKQNPNDVSPEAEDAIQEIQQAYPELVKAAMSGQQEVAEDTLDEYQANNADLAKLAYNAYIRAKRDGKEDQAKHYFMKYNKYKSEADKDKPVSESKMAELDDDLKNMSDEDFLQFYGKSKDEVQKVLGYEEPPFEPDAEPSSDTDEFGNPIKHKARHLAHKGMNAELDRLKNLSGVKKD